MQRGQGAWPWGERGQASVEYALVLCAFVASVVALAVLWHAAQDGALLRLATGASSHGLGSQNAVASAQDLLLY